MGWQRAGSSVVRTTSTSAEMSEVARLSQNGSFANVRGARRSASRSAASVGAMPVWTTRSNGLRASGVAEAMW